MSAANIVTYSHDIFVSYRRRDMWPVWVREHFVPLLTRYLNDELDWDVRIFFDHRIEKTNVTWPIALAPTAVPSSLQLDTISPVLSPRL
jgi:hypothetical protein